MARAVLTTRLATRLRIAIWGSLFVAASPICVVAQDEADDWTELTISPRQVAEPLLAQRLFPDGMERRPGNAAVIILRLAWEKSDRVWKPLKMEAHKYLDMPAEEFSPEEAREKIPLFDFDELRRAAFRRDVDWQYPVNEGAQLQYLLVPDAGEISPILRGLAVHCRADIFEGKIDDALEKITVGLGVLWHFEKTPFPLMKIIAASNMNMMIDRVEELVEHPKSPNLYWALTALPDPLIDLRPMVDCERQVMLAHVPEVRDLSRQRSEKQWREIHDRLRPFGSFEGGGFMGHDFDRKGRLPVDVKRARRELPKLRPALAERVESMSDDEVVVRYFVIRYTTESDRAVCGLLLPPHEAMPLLQRIEDRQREDSPEFGNLLMASSEICADAWGIRRRIDALRIVEALRDYAARHDGQLPDSLGDVRETPIPVDVFTRQPFEYRRQGDTAYLSAEPIDVYGKKLCGIRYRLCVPRKTGGTHRVPSAVETPPSGGKNRLKPGLQRIPAKRQPSEGD
ncbi:MAG: hypothetical protein ACYTG0_02780 [Planctomycetota bacterium]|jgi:hypothetical protein